MNLFRRLCAALPVALLSGALPATLQAEPRQHGNVVYTIPEGWVTGKRENGIQLLLSDLPGDECEFCRIYLGPAQVKTGAPDKLLRRNLRVFLEEDDPDPEPVGEASTLRMGTHLVAMQGVKSGRDLQILVAVEIADRTEIFGFEGDGDDEAGSRESLKVFERDMLPMVLAARYLTEGAQPVMRAPQPGDLSGVWQGTGTTWTIGLDMMMKMELRSELYVFWKDGIFYAGSPPGGTASFDRAAALQAGDMSWGSYLLEGDRLKLSYVDGVTEEMVVADGDMQKGFTCDFEAHCAPVKPLPDGTKINGRIETLFYSGFSPGSGLSGGMHAASTLYFAPDGTWSYESSSGASANFDAGGGFATSSGRENTGRYRVENGVVIRSFSDGSPDQVEMIFLNAAGEVMIGGDFLQAGP